MLCSNFITRIFVPRILIFGLIYIWIFSCWLLYWHVLYSIMHMNRRRRVPRVELELITLPELLSSPRICSGVRFVQSKIVFCTVLCRSFFVVLSLFCCIVCHSLISTKVVRTPFMAKSTQFNIVWYNLTVTCDRSVVCFGYSDFLYQWNWISRYSWVFNERGVRHHKPSTTIFFHLWLLVTSLVSSNCSSCICIIQANNIIVSLSTMSWPVKLIKQFHFRH
jgi:hypothetical protein